MLSRRLFMQTAMAAALAGLLGRKGRAAPGQAPFGALDGLLGEGASVRVRPEQVWREKPVTVEFTVTLGKGGLAANDSLGIVNGSYIDRWNFSFPSHWWGEQPPWQVADPDASNHVTAACSRSGVHLRLAVGERGGSKPYCNQPGHMVRSLRERMRYVLEVAPDQPLEAGDAITLHWRDAAGPAAAMHYFFLPFVFSRLPEQDRKLPIRRGRFHDLPSIRVRGHTAERLHLACQPLVGAGEPFALTIAAVDKYGNPAEDFADEVRLACDGDAALPETVRFSKEDQGHKRIEGLKVQAPGWWRIAATAGGVSGRSNYIVASDEPPAQRLYFGDMHTHTLDCDGTPDLTEHFQYAPNVAGLDFGAVSCHAEYFGCKAAWDRYLRLSAEANQPGRFVTFYGYEWANDGHTNAYFLRAEEAALIYGPRLVKGGAPDAPPFRTPCKTEGEFMRMLRAHAHPVFCIAHCHTKYGEEADDRVLWLDEVYSAHQRDRKKREDQLRGNLARGLRLGVVAGSDMHRLTMGHLCKQPGEVWPQGGRERCQYQTAGLQATFAGALDRKALYEGMRARQTYGTSGARIILLFRCGGHPLGAEVTLAGNETAAFHIGVGGTGPLTEVALCRYDGESWTETPCAIDANSDRWAGTPTAGPGESGIYYVRVTQADGEQAWSSPVWLSRA